MCTSQAVTQTLGLGLTLTIEVKWICSFCVQMHTDTQAPLSLHVFMRIVTEQTSLPGRHFPTILQIWITAHSIQYARKSRAWGRVTSLLRGASSMQLCKNHRITCAIPRQHLTHGPSPSYTNCSPAVEAACLTQSLLLWQWFSVILNGSRHIKEVHLRKTDFSRGYCFLAIILEFVILDTLRNCLHY